MRKLLPCLLLVLLALFVCQSACAESHVLDSIYSSVDVPDTYIVLTADNLSANSDWLASRGLGTEDVANDFIKRGVLLQCWSESYDVCFEVTAVSNDRSKNIFDVNEQSQSIRGTYRTGFYPDNLYSGEGYDFTASDWKNSSNGRFLVLRYSKRDNGEVLYRGLMRRTIRNGFEITLDYQVYGRNVTNKDNSALNAIWDTYRFIEVLPLPASASAKINITAPPPAQTKEQSFDIKGTAAEGVKFTSVVMGLNYDGAIQSEYVVPKNGKFTMPIQLPKEGAFVLTLSAEYMGDTIMEQIYPISYQRTLLVVNVTSEIPTVVTTDTLSILGTGEPGATIQVFVNDDPGFSKKITNAGKFKVDIDTSAEGEYTVELAFSKTNLADQRLSYTFTRQWTEQDMIKELKKQAVKPGYGTLVKKIDGYSGRIMGYTGYLTSITGSGDRWILQMALKKSGKNYSNIILVTSAEEPTFAIGDRVVMYGTCTGMSEIGADDAGTGADATPTDETGAATSTAETTVQSYPCFSLLLLATP